MIIDVLRWYVECDMYVKQSGCQTKAAAMTNNADDDGSDDYNDGGTKAGMFTMILITMAMTMAMALTTMAAGATTMTMTMAVMTTRTVTAANGDDDVRGRGHGHGCDFDDPLTVKTKTCTMLRKCGDLTRLCPRCCRFVFKVSLVSSFLTCVRKKP